MSKKLPTLFIQFSNALSASIVIPILPLLAVDHFGATAFQAISLESSYYLTKLISTPYLAALSDRYGRKPIFLFGQCGTFLGLILILGVAPALNGTSWGSIQNLGIIILFLARSLDGVTGGNSTIARIFLTEVLEKKEHTQALGQLAAMQGVGFILGPALGGMMATRFGFFAPFACGAILSIGALLIISFFIPTKPPVRVAQDELNQSFGFDFKEIFRHPVYLKLAIIAFAGPLCFAAISPSLVLYVDHRFFNPANQWIMSDVSQFVGWMYTLVGICLVISQLLLIKPIGRKLDDARITLVGQVGLSISFLAVPFFSSPYLFLAVLLAAVLFYGLIEPSLQTLIVHASDDQNVGKRLGMYAALTSLANLLGPLWAGWLFQYFSPQSIWWVSSLLLIPTAIISLRLVNLKKPMAISA
ncbi:MAG: MFS transporter [Chloroflexota bacterium]